MITVRTQTMLPLTVGRVCVFMYLAASTITVILSLFLIYFMMCGTSSETDKEERNQGSKTSEEPVRPLCLARQ